MERRTVSNLALAASAAVVVVGLVILVVLVRAESSAALSGPETAAPQPVEGPDRAAPDRTPPPEVERRASESPSGARVKRGANAGPTVAATLQTKEPAPPAPAAPVTTAAPDPLDGPASEASEYYGRGDHESALEQAAKVLQQKPSRPIREWMLRIASSSACFLGDADRARVYYDQLPPEGRPDVEKRCAKFGIEFR